MTLEPTLPKVPAVTAAPAYLEGHHAVSPFNFEADLQASYAFRQPMVLIDSTIRKILKTTGTRVSTKAIVEIAELLAELGIHEMVLNISWWGDAKPAPAEFDAYRAIMAADLGFGVTVDCDALGITPYYPQTVTASDVLDILQEVGVHTVGIPADFRAGDSTSQSDRARALFEETIADAQRRGIKCQVQVVDAGRRDFRDVVAAANLGINLGASTIGLSDSYSSLSPEAMKLFIAALRRNLITDVPMSMHAHNDFGLANASTIAAASAGAYPDVSVNGVSYRGGFAALEEVALSLELLYGVRSGVQLDKLQAVSDKVALLMGFPKSPMKPVTGVNAYLRDHPMWMIEYLDDTFPPSASCYAPSVVGARMGMVWGHHPGNAVIRTKLHHLGLQASPDQVAEIRKRLDDLLQSKTEYPFWVSEDEMDAVCKSVCGADVSNE